MESLLTDGELLARSVEKPAVFGELFERHELAVRRYVGRRLGDAAAADIASEVFIRAFRARGRYRPERDAALPWLLGIANHVIADHRRLERRRLATLARSAGQAPGIVEHRDSDLAPELVAALRQLPRVERDTLLLIVWGELTREEAAAALGVPVGTINSRVARARKRLAAALTQAPPAHPAELRLNGETHV
ncbi:MAG: RNA polymerase sigma factor [Trebonia sp.]